MWYFQLPKSWNISVIYEFPSWLCKNKTSSNDVLKFFPNDTTQNPVDNFAISFLESRFFLFFSLTPLSVNRAPSKTLARLCWERHLGPDKETKWCETRFSRQICQFTTVENTFLTTFPNPTRFGKLPSNPRPEHDTPHPHLASIAAMVGGLAGTGPRISHDLVWK